MKTNKYLVNTPLGFFIVEADSSIEAWTKCMTDKYHLNIESFLDREDLIKLGYKTVTPTGEYDVFLIE